MPIKNIIILHSTAIVVTNWCTDLIGDCRKLLLLRFNTPENAAGKQFTHKKLRNWQCGWQIKNESIKRAA